MTTWLYGRQLRSRLDKGRAETAPRQINVVLNWVEELKAVSVSDPGPAAFSSPRRDGVN